MKAKVLKYGLNIQVDSAGTSGWHDGELPDSRSIANAKEKMELTSLISVPEK